MSALPLAEIRRFLEDHAFPMERAFAGPAKVLERFGSLEPADVKRLRQLEQENGRLKKMVADLSLDKEMLQDVIRRKI
mgnify:CR=1 FL=1